MQWNERFDELDRVVADLEGLVTGSLVIGASTTAGEQLLPTHLGQCHSAYPGVRLSVRIGNSAVITDLVAAGIDSEEVVTMLGNGDGTFTASTPQDSGGPTWVSFVADVNGDGDLDVVNANSFTGLIGINIGNGDGTFDPPTTVSEGAHVPSVDLGDLDGDGDVDMVVSSFGGQFWRVHLNDGTGDFSFQEECVSMNCRSTAAVGRFQTEPVAAHQEPLCPYTTHDNNGDKKHQHQ